MSIKPLFTIYYNIEWIILEIWVKREFAPIEELEMAWTKVGAVITGF